MRPAEAAAASAPRVALFGAGASVAQALPANFWGVVPAGEPEPGTAPAAEARRGRQHPHPDLLEPRSSRPGDGALRLVEHRLRMVDTRRGGDRSAAVPLRRPPPGRSRRSRCQAPAAASRRRVTCRCSGAAALRLAAFVSAGGRPLRRRRQLLDREPDRPAAPDPHLADLERGELQVLRRQARTRPNTGSWSSSPRRRGQSRRPGRQGHPRRPLRAAERGDASTAQAAARLLRHRLPRADVQDGRRGSSPSSRASPCTRTPANYQHLTPLRSKNCATC